LSNSQLAYSVNSDFKASMEGLSLETVEGDGKCWIFIGPSINLLES
jgi:hypothetical protein